MKTIKTIVMLFTFFALAMTSDAQEFISYPAHLNMGQGLGHMALAVTGSSHNTGYDFVHIKTGKVFSTRLGNELLAQPGDYLVLVPKVKNAEAAAPKVEFEIPALPLHEKLDEPAAQRIFAHKVVYTTFRGLIGFALISLVAILTLRAKRHTRKPSNIKRFTQSENELPEAHSPEPEFREEAVPLTPLDYLDKSDVEEISVLVEECLADKEVGLQIDAKGVPIAAVTTDGPREKFFIHFSRQRCAYVFARLFRQEWEKQNFPESYDLYVEVLESSGDSTKVAFGVHQKRRSNIRAFPQAVNA